MENYHNLVWEPFFGASLLSLLRGSVLFILGRVTTAVSRLVFDHDGSLSNVRDRTVPVIIAARIHAVVRLNQQLVLKLFFTTLTVNFSQRLERFGDTLGKRGLISRIRDFRQVLASQSSDSNVSLRAFIWRGCHR